MPLDPPSASNDYDLTDQHVLTGQLISTIFKSISDRLKAREALEADFEALIAEGTQAALTIIQNNLAPELADLQQAVSDAEQTIADIAENGVAPNSERLGGELPDYYASMSYVQNALDNDPDFADSMATSLSGKLDNFTGAWIKSSDGVNRFHFGTNGPTYINAIGGHGYNFLVSNNLVTQAVFKPDGHGTYLQLCGDSSLEGGSQIQFCTDYTRTKVNWSIHDNVANSLHFYGWTGANGTGNYEQQFFVHQQGTLWTRSYGYLHEKFIAHDDVHERLSTTAQFVNDWNDAIDTGFYQAANKANDPFNAGVHTESGYYIGLVIKHTDDWITQEVFLFTSTGEANTKTFRRTKLGGTWHQWYRVYKSATEIKELGPKKFEYAITSGIASGAAWSAAHGLGSVPDVVSVSLRFKVAYGGYLVGEELEVNPHLNTTYDYAKGFAIAKTPSMLNIRLGTNPNPVDILDTAGNIHTAIGAATLAANCDIIIRAVKY